MKPKRKSRRGANTVILASPRAYDREFVRWVTTVFFNAFDKRNRRK